MATPPKRDSTAIARTRALKARFDAVHREGMAALRRHDYTALGDAIAAEHDIIGEQGKIIDEQSAALDAERLRLVFTGRGRKPPKV